MTACSASRPARARDPDGTLRTAGGRVLCVTAIGRDTEAARDARVCNLARVHFEGMQARSDIGRPGDRWQRVVTGAVRVGIVVGSESDLPVMGACGDVLVEYGIGWEIGVMSAHRAGDVVRAYALAAHERGLRVLVAGAGAAAHLPGVLASLTTLPVIGVPLAATPLAGFELTPLDRADATRASRSRPLRSARWGPATPGISPPRSSGSSTPTSPRASGISARRCAPRCSSPRDSRSSRSGGGADH